jgi:hypothetical protein
MKKILLVLFGLMSISCNMVSQSLPSMATSIPIPTTAASGTATPQATPSSEPSATFTPPPSPTASVAAITATVTIDSADATVYASMGSLGVLMNIRQYFNPVGAPAQTWHNVPIMPEATRGQEFNPNVYSFIATATLDQATQFYAGKVKALGVTNSPSTGSSGSGSQAVHSVTFYTYNVTILLNAYDNDAHHVTVIIGRVP